MRTLKLRFNQSSKFYLTAVIRFLFIVGTIGLVDAVSWSAASSTTNSLSTSTSKTTSDHPQSLLKKNLKNVVVKESILDIQGKTFRKIEYQNEAYFLELTESPAQVSGGDLRVLCQKNIATPEISGSLVKVGVKTTSRSHFFIEALKQNCKEVFDSGSRREIQIDPRMQVGFEYDIKTQSDSKNKLQKQNEIFKNIKLVLTPIDGVSFKADW